MSRDHLIAAVTTAWNDIPARDKPALMLAHPELYAAVARLAADVAVRADTH